MTIGQRIRERRKVLDLSVDDLAKKLNKNRATIYRYESDDIENMPLTVLEPLAEALKTTPAYLMGWDEEATNAKDDFLEDNEVRAVARQFSGLSDQDKSLFKQFLEKFREDNDD